VTRDLFSDWALRKVWGGMGPDAAGPMPPGSRPTRTASSSSARSPGAATGAVIGRLPLCSSARRRSPRHRQPLHQVPARQNPRARVLPARLHEFRALVRYGGSPAYLASGGDTLSVLAGMAVGNLAKSGACVSGPHEARLGVRPAPRRWSWGHGRGGDASGGAARQVRTQSGAGSAASGARRARAAV
jgi:hypothetical protein